MSPDDLGKLSAADKLAELLEHPSPLLAQSPKVYTQPGSALPSNSPSSPYGTYFHLMAPYAQSLAIGGLASGLPHHYQVHDFNVQLTTEIHQTHWDGILLITKDVFSNLPTERSCMSSSHVFRSAPAAVQTAAQWEDEAQRARDHSTLSRGLPRKLLHPGQRTRYRVSHLRAGSIRQTTRLRGESPNSSHFEPQQRRSRSAYQNRQQCQLQLLHHQRHPTGPRRL